MKHWFSDGALRSIVRNAGLLLSSNIVGALLGLLALACAGRGMSPALFGTLVVVQAYAKTVSDIVKFQTWQLVVRFGTPALTKQDYARFCDVTRFSFGLDLASGLVAFIGGVVLLPFVGHAMGIGHGDLWLALGFCTLIPVLTSATPMGILRAIDRFDLLAVQQAATPALRAVGSVISYLCGFGFPGFIITWYVAGFVGNGVLWLFAVQELRRQGIKGALRPGLFEPARRIKSAWDFVWTTNISHSIWSARNAGSNVIVGVVLGPEAAGLFKIATTFFDAAGTPADILEKSFYPEIMRLNPREKHPWRLGLRSAALAAGLGVVVSLLMMVIGKPLITIAFGAEYLDAFTLLKIMMASIIISMAAFPLEALLYMACRQRSALVSQSLAVIFYVTLLIGFSHWYGVVGAAWAYFFGQCLDALFLLMPTLGAYRKRHLLVNHVREEAV